LRRDRHRGGLLSNCMIKGDTQASIAAQDATG